MMSVHVAHAILDGLLFAAVVWVGIFIIVVVLR